MVSFLFYLFIFVIVIVLIIILSTPSNEINKIKKKNLCVAMRGKKGKAEHNATLNMNLKGNRKRFFFCFMLIEKKNRNFLFKSVHV